jgi:MarR family
VELSSTISRRPPNSNGEVDITSGRLALSPGCPITATDRVADDFLVPLFDITRRLRAYAEQLARAHGMTGEELMIIARLERQPDLSFDELASIGAVTAKRLARLIGGLETRGIIERSSDPRSRVAAARHQGSSRQSAKARDQGDRPGGSQHDGFCSARNRSTIPRR